MKYATSLFFHNMSLQLPAVKSHRWKLGVLRPLNRVTYWKFIRKCIAKVYCPAHTERMGIFRDLRVDLQLLWNWESAETRKSCLLGPEIQSSGSSPASPSLPSITWEGKEQENCTKPSFSWCARCRLYCLFKNRYHCFTEALQSLLVQSARMYNTIYEYSCISPIF